MKMIHLGKFVVLHFGRKDVFVCYQMEVPAKSHSGL